MSPADNHVARSELLSELRAIRSSLTTHFASGTVVQQRLLKVLSRSASETLYRFGSTENKFLNALGTIEEHLELLSQNGQHQTKIFVGRHIFNKLGFAAYIVEQEGDAAKRQETNVVDEALRIINEKHVGINTQLKRLREQHGELQAAGKELLGHIRASKRLALLAKNVEVTEDLEACIWMALDVGIIKSQSQRAVEQRATELLQEEHMLYVFSRLITNYLASIESTLQNEIEKRNTQVLRRAARRSVEKLEKKRPENDASKLIEAIAAIRFAYACEQHLDYGKMTSTTRMEYEKLLQKAPQEQMEQAIREILDREILSPEDLRLLRYVDSVQTALTNVTS